MDVDFSMERVSEIRLIKRTAWDEFGYRSNWLILGVAACILLAFIPIIGWIMAFGVSLTVLWKTFGFSEKRLVGDCPFCTCEMSIEPKIEEIDCPVCGSYFTIRDNCLFIEDDD